MTESTLRFSTCNFPSSGRPANYKPFRLVFLDSCESAKGYLCEVFGITPQTLNVQFFKIAGVRPRAFLGFTNTITFNFNQSDFREGMLTQFWVNWMRGKTLDYCAHQAETNYPLCPMDSSWTIYGAKDMKIDSW
jgi:hypothetical protein